MNFTTQVMHRKYIPGIVYNTAPFSQKEKISWLGLSVNSVETGEKHQSVSISMACQLIGSKGKGEGIYKRAKVCSA